jgi:hypothetical protein
MKRATKITKRSVDAAHQESDRYIVWDTDLKGFGLLVLPSNVKTYIFNYRTKNGVDRRYSIGKHGGQITPDWARKRAGDLQREVHDGRDPVADKREHLKAP